MRARRSVRARLGAIAAAVAMTAGAVVAGAAPASAAEFDWDAEYGLLYDGQVSHEVTTFWNGFAIEVKTDFPYEYLIEVVSAEGRFAESGAPLGVAYQEDNSGDAYAHFELDPGTYRVHAISSPAYVLIPWSGAEIVIPETGSISGTVLSSGERPVSPATVSVRAIPADSDGEDPSTPYYAGFLAEDGSYSIANLPVGDYVVKAAWGCDCYPAWPSHVDEYYNDVRTQAQAEVVTVTANAVASGIDFELEPTTAVHGTVDAGGAVVTVTAYADSDGTWEPVRADTYDFSLEEWGADGFVQRGLVAGSYTFGFSAEGRCTQYLGGVADIAEADTVTLLPDGLTDLGAITLPVECAVEPEVPVEPETPVDPEVPVGPTDPELPTTGGAEVTLDVTEAAQGAGIAVAGTGFDPGESVRIELHSTPIVLGTATADANGEVGATVTIPASAETGAHTIVLIGETSGARAEIALTVTAGETNAGAGDDGEQLPATGGELAAGVLALGAMLVVTGLALVRLRGRRLTV